MPCAYGAQISQSLQIASSKLGGMGWGIYVDYRTVKGNLTVTTCQNLIPFTPGLRVYLYQEIQLFAENLSVYNSVFKVNLVTASTQSVGAVDVPLSRCGYAGSKIDSELSTNWPKLRFFSGSGILAYRSDLVGPG